MNSDKLPPDVAEALSGFLAEWEDMKQRHVDAMKALGLAMKIVTRHSPDALRSFPETDELMRLLERGFKTQTHD